MSLLTLQIIAAGNIHRSRLILTNNRSSTYKDHFHI